MGDLDHGGPGFACIIAVFNGFSSNLAGICFFRACFWYDLCVVMANDSTKCQLGFQNAFSFTPPASTRSA